MINWIIISIICLAAVIIIFWLYSNRDPIRTIPSENNVVSPADGRIIEIIDLFELKKKKQKIEIKKGWIGKIRAMASDISSHGYLISIFMTPLDVHVQRAPVEGKVVSVEHTKGRFFSANSLRATVENEKNEIIIENKDIGKIKVIQIAGFFARRIIYSVKKNEMLLKGQKIGRIKFGSQVVLIMPDLYLKAKKGDYVLAGETVIAGY